MSDHPETNAKSQSELLERIPTIQEAAGIDDATRRSAMSIAGELSAQEFAIRSSTRTAAACLLAACRLRETLVRVTVLAAETSVPKAKILDEYIESDRFQENKELNAAALDRSGEARKIN